MPSAAVIRRRSRPIPTRHSGASTPMRRVFRDFVMRYVAVNNRAASPKFLYGESYGGPRSGVLAFLLESAGVHLSGVVLQSPAMNYNSNCGVIAATISCAGYLPSYGATGSWYNLTQPNAGHGGTARLHDADAHIHHQRIPSGGAQFPDCGDRPCTVAADAIVQHHRRAGIDVAGTLQSRCGHGRGEPHARHAHWAATIRACRCPIPVRWRRTIRPAPPSRLRSRRASRTTFPGR